MRTTVRIDDELYRAVKERALRSGRTVGEVIEDAVRQALASPQGAPPEPPPPLPTFGRGGVLPGVDLTGNAGLRDVMDTNDPLDALH